MAGAKKKNAKKQDGVDEVATPGQEEVGKGRAKGHLKDKKDREDALEADVVTHGQIVYKMINDLTLLEANPRLIGKTELNKLCNSLESDKSYFEQRPCLINKVGDKLVVYAGNMRVRAAVQLGWRLVPCIVDEIPNDLQEVRMFKDNMHYAEFDMGMLLKTFDPAYLMHDVGMDIDKKTLQKHLKEQKDNAGVDTVSMDAIQPDLTLEDESLYIAEKFTNGTKPDAFHFRQYEIPMNKDAYQNLANIVADYKKKNKGTTNFLRDFRIAVQIGMTLEPSK